MKRQVPAFSAVRLASRRDPLFELDLSVVTPMFGGSAEPGEVDPECPIRGSTIRGHLRFWWRACVAHRYESAERLFEDESAIWGATSGSEGKPSAIEVEVEVLDRQQIVLRPCAKYEERPRRSPQLQWLIDSASQRNQSDPLGYALFPFRGEMESRQVAQQPSKMAENVRFRLCILRAPSKTSIEETSLRQQVEAALWAWITFGGIGARTRRGCGTLWTNHADFCPPANAPVKKWLDERAKQHLAGRQVEKPLPLPKLKGATILVGRPRETNAAWREAVNWLRGYRQRRSGGAMGRSLWPEADAIRALAGTSARGTPPPTTTPLYFPRGELGLPIIFHFKDRGDPPDHTLQAAAPGATRMASPFITKALAISERQGLPMVVRLQAPLLHQLGVQAELNGQPVTVYNPQLAQHAEPLLKYHADNPVDGFMEYLREKGQTEEVTLE